MCDRTFVLLVNKCPCCRAPTCYMLHGCMGGAPRTPIAKVAISPGTLDCSQSNLPLASLRYPQGLKTELLLGAVAKSRPSYAHLIKDIQQGPTVDISTPTGALETRAIAL